MVKKNNLIFLELLAVISLSIVPFITGTVYIFHHSPFLPILAFSSFLGLTHIFRKKYRVYAFLFYVPLTSFLGLKINNVSIGSLLTLMIFIYFIEIIIENIFDYKKTGLIPKLQAVIPLMILIFTMSISNLINIRTISIVKYFSIVLYWIMPFLMLLDKRAEKKRIKMIIFLSISFLLVNAFAFMFIYIFKDKSVNFVETYLPDVYEEYLKKVSLDGFRFTGMVGDSNHNALIILVISCLCFYYLYLFGRHWIPLIFLVALLQPFGFIGGSKTYIVGFVVCLVAFIILFFKHTTFFPFIIVFASVALVIGTIFILTSASLSKSLTRLLLIDDRVGFLESFTTYRASIWDEYLSNITRNPINLIFGNGTQAKRLYGADYHNSFIELLWEYGVVGTICWINYFKTFVVRKNKNNTTIGVGLFVVLVIFAFSLHIIYEETLYVSLFVFSILISVKKPLFIGEHTNALYAFYKLSI